MLDVMFVSGNAFIEKKFNGCPDITILEFENSLKVNFLFVVNRTLISLKKMKITKRKGNYGKKRIID